MTVADIGRLRRQAAQLRLEVVRMMGADKAHHFGGSMSAADIVSALYFHVMRYDPQNPEWPERDRFIMSKGHCVPAQYAALAMIGVFPMEELPTLKLMGTRLQGHPAAHLLPGIEACTGSLGQGLSFANGVALGSRISGIPFDAYCLVGDGEIQEGQIWEAAMTAAKQCLGNVTLVLDANGLKGMDEPSCAKMMQPMAARWQSFGWYVREIDGHDMTQIVDAFDWAKGNTDGPSIIIANTVKGKGISFIEGHYAYHNASLTEKQLAMAIDELETNLESLSEEVR